jgi:deoxyribodipyrimidine photolyase-related protein
MARHLSRTYDSGLGECVVKQMSELVVVLGDQLFEGLPGMPADCPVFMREDVGLAKNYRHHQQKIVLFFSAMRHFAASLKREVIYEKYTGEGSYFESLTAYCHANRITKVWFYAPNDPDSFDLKNFQLPYEVVPNNPMFLTPKADWERYEKGNKRRLMGDFYIQQRRRMGILVDADGEPQGGKWSFDGDNRKALPKNVNPPIVDHIEPDDITQDVIQTVIENFQNHPGDARDFRYAVTHEGARAWLKQFLVERLELFGDYEDAIPQRERTLFHSLLTPYLNCGLLTPAEVVEETLRLDTPLNSKEGFLRQIIGWREFMFGMSTKYPEIPNFFGHQRRMKSCWYDGTTGLPPVDMVIQRANKHAYCHHIERLMVLGSVMLMSELHPEDVYKWFMEMFIDSAEWVMKPNVLGMSQFADGGLFATKPYICGSAYILKMSDWKKGDWCEIWDGLYWRFIHRNRDYFGKNYRMASMVSMVDKMDPIRKARIFKAAEDFIERVGI